MTSKNNESLVGLPPILIAHRGYSGRYPENTLIAYQAAYDHGARFVELDLQMSKDLVPFVHHDESLYRMSGVDSDIRETKAKHIKALPASYPERFGEEFADNKFATFRKFTKWLKRRPEVIAFVEIKQESIDKFGMEVFVDATYKRIKKAEVETQCVIISFNSDVVSYTRKISSLEVGWVLPKWDKDNEALLIELNPEYMFCDKESLPDSDDEVWKGAWKWAIYNLDDAGSAIKMANRGFKYLETNQIGTLMADSQLSRGSDR